MAQFPDNFWNTKSLEVLVAEQRVRPVQDLEEVLGKGAELWETDEQLERFLAEI